MTMDDYFEFASIYFEFASIYSYHFKKEMSSIIIIYLKGAAFQFKLLKLILATRGTRYEHCSLDHSLLSGPLASMFPRILPLPILLPSDQVHPSSYHVNHPMFSSTISIGG